MSLKTRLVQLGPASLPRLNLMPGRLKDTDHSPEEGGCGLVRICRLAVELEARPSECIAASVDI